MHNFTASLAEIAILGVGVSLLVAWITYFKTARIKDSLLELAQDHKEVTFSSPEIEAMSGDALGVASGEEAASGRL